MTIAVQMIATRRGTFGIRRDPTSTGRPVLCLHGFPHDAATFDDLSERLKTSGYAATALYLRGYSPSPMEGPLDLPSLVRDIFADRRVAANSFEYVDRLWRRGGSSTRRGRSSTSREAHDGPQDAWPCCDVPRRRFQRAPRGHPHPTLFICGIDDGCSLPQMADGQQRLFSGRYERQTWDGTGHFPHLEHPPRVAAEVTRWSEAAGG